MKMSLGPLFQMSLKRILLGICLLLFEIHESQEMSGLRWSACTTLLATASVVASTSTTPVITPETPDVDGIPQFHSPQLRLTVKRGDRVLLPCKIHNLGDNHVIWRHGTNVLAGTNVSTYADQRIQLHPDLTLEITGVTREDEGEYECIFTGPFSNSGLTHSVTVHDAPTVSLTTSTHLVVTEGDNAEIGCIGHGNPSPRISWSMRDGQISIPSSMLHEPTITLEKVTRRHAGLYVCTADNNVGRPAIGAVYVRVLYTPEIEIPKRRVHGGVDYNSHLTCVVHSDPPADVKWRIGKDPVELDERVHTEVVNYNEYNLVFSRVRAHDFSTYTCEANNSLGYDIRHIEFTGVPNPPMIIRWETQILVKGTVGDESSTEGTQMEEEISVTLFWVVECYSSLNDYRLHFRPDKRNQINSYNEDETPPWTELTIPADQSSASFIHTKTFTLRGLQPSAIYEAAIKARNKYGWSQLSKICHFSTFPNSSSAKQQEFEGSIFKWGETLGSGGRGDLDLLSEEEIAEYMANDGNSLNTYVHKDSIQIFYDIFLYILFFLSLTNILL